MNFSSKGPDTPEWKPESKILGLSESQALARAALDSDAQGNSSGGGGIPKFTLERKPTEEVRAKPLELDTDSYVTQVIPSKIHWTYGPSGRRVAFLRRHDNGSEPGPT